jgi:hypothetical protein
MDYIIVLPGCPLMNANLRRPWPLCLAMDKKLPREGLAPPACGQSTALDERKLGC